MGKAVKKIAPIAALATPFIPGLGAAIGPIGQVLGAVSQAQQIFGGREERRAPPAPRAAPPPAEAPPFEPTRPPALARPPGISELAAFTPQQERAALATRGLQVGLGAEEEDYYRNLLQRSLIGEGGQVSGQQDFLLPVESQYFAQRGIGTGSPLEFLKGLR